MIRSWSFKGNVELFLYNEKDEDDLPGDWPSLASPAERERAAKMGSPARAYTFLRTRTLLRQKLGKRLSLNPANIAIDITMTGKPFLADPFDGIVFSLSHSHDLILIGIATGKAALGVDLEYIDPATDIETIARRSFTGEDRQALALTVPDQRRQLAFQIWCLKEARFKSGRTTLNGMHEQSGLLDNNFAYALCYAS
jgi:4'-phosphopantetheinyl transferase